MLRLGPRNCAAGLEGRRWASRGAPDMPLAAAAMAAMLLAAVELMLLRRVMRCAGFMEVDMECECGRDLGSEPAMELEWRCWLDGRTWMGSWMDREVSASNCSEGSGESVKEITHLEDSHGVEGQLVGGLFFVRQGKRAVEYKK